MGELFQLLRHGGVPLHYKLIFLSTMFIYTIWPIDLIIDIPPIGYIDDVAIIGVGSYLFVKLAQRRLEQEF